MEHFTHLFQPIRIGGIDIPNRICHVPTDTSTSNADGSVSERDIAHHAQLAKGGCGLIIVGATAPDAKTGRPTVTGFVADSDSYIPGLARLAASMHQYGAKCLVQLQHPGRQAAIPRGNYMSADDTVVRIPWSAGHEIVYAGAEEKGKSIKSMSTEQVLDMVELFGDAASRVMRAGFDGVELHAAHGYLISGFMSPLLNHRIDRFGGSFENRMRFPLAIIANIQQKCGKAFPIFVRYSADEWVEGGRDLSESLEVAKRFEQAGVCCLDLSQCVQESPGAGFDPMQYPEGWTMYASEAVKKVVSIPVINSHSLRNPAYCEEVLAAGKTDMVGLSRQMLADPYWAIKAQYGKVDDIRRCISCLVGCWQESLMAQREIKCSINPACNDPRFENLKKAEESKNLAVVGGGPAGMEFARIAALMGHTVTLYEASGELGGAILGCCMAPGKEKMKWYADWIRRQVRTLPGITIHMNTAPDPAALKGYDFVLLATGARSQTPDMVCGAELVTPFEKAIACPKVSCEHHPKNGRTPVKLPEAVLVWGDGYPALDTATFLASIGKRVTLVTEAKEFGSAVEVIHMYVSRKRFQQQEAEALEPKPYKYPVTLLERATVESFDGETAIVMNSDFVRTSLPCGAVVNCHVAPVNGLATELATAGIPYALAGDAKTPRNLGAAVFEGAETALLCTETLRNPNGAPVGDLPLELRAILKG